MIEKGNIIERRDLVRKINLLLDYHQITDTRVQNILHVPFGTVQALRRRNTPVFTTGELQKYYNKLASKFEGAEFYPYLDEN